MPAKISKTSKILKIPKISSIHIITILIILLFLLIIFYCYIARLATRKLQDVQTKKWMSDLTDVIILGVNDRKLYSKIDRDGENISFWYVYWFFHTKQETIWILANLRNKFSTAIVFSIYKYNFVTKTSTSETLNVDMKDIVVHKSNNTLTLKIKDIYVQEINLMENKSSLRVNTNKFKIFVNLSITDCTTNQASFAPPFHNILSHIVNVKGIQTSTPGEWFSDNPYIGKILNGVVNGKEINEGVYWFDNFIGCNNAFLTTYTWFVVLNEDWLIYILMFGDDDNFNDSSTLKPIIIKDIKNDKVIYSGILAAVTDIFNPIDIKAKSSKKIGNETYDDYSISFESDEINIHIQSIQNSCKKVYEYSFYKSDDIHELGEGYSDWDKEYYEILKNITYVEYVVDVNVSIDYNGNKEIFECRQVIDAMYRKNNKIPRTIEYAKNN